MRVGYNYLGEQTIPRVGLSPTGNTALWAAHAVISGRCAEFEEMMNLPESQNQNPSAAYSAPLYIFVGKPDLIHAM